MENDDLPPDLDDFQNVFDTCSENNKKKLGIQGFQGDYTKTIDELQNEIEEKLLLEQKNKETIIQKQEKVTEKVHEKQFKGLKKGFFDNDKPSKKDEVIELKQDKSKETTNIIPEVQQAMQMKDYLNNNQKEWMTPDLLKTITENPKLAKAFTNPEYMNAITMMQTKPKEVMERYGKNPEFMMILQEFTKVMGANFQKIGEEDKKKQQNQQQPLDKEQIELQKKLQDPQVMQILQNEKVKAFLEYLQKNRGADWNAIMQKDPDLAQKLNVLIQKGVISLQKGM